MLFHGWESAIGRKLGIPCISYSSFLRALLQRRKGRDLFDLYHGLEELAFDIDQLLACFHHYLKLENQKISRAMAEQRMLQKLTGSLTEDIAPLLPVGVRFDDEAAIEAFNRIWARLIVKLKGETWKSTENAISELRLKKYPKLLC
jgi:hypothetical protein